MVMAPRSGSWATEGQASINVNTTIPTGIPGGDWRFMRLFNSHLPIQHASDAGAGPTNALMTMPLGRRKERRKSKAFVSALSPTTGPEIFRAWVYTIVLEVMLESGKFAQAECASGDEPYLPCPHFASGTGDFNTTSRAPGIRLPTLTLPPGQRTLISETAGDDGKTRPVESCDQ